MTIDLCNATTLNEDNLCRNMDILHIPMADGPPLLSIDHWNTTTLYYFDLVFRNMESHIKNYRDSTVQAHYHFTVFTISHMDIAPLSLSCCYYVIGPPVINHTSLEHHYTISHIKNAHIPMTDIPPIYHTSLEHHYTKAVSHIEECIYTHGGCTSSDI